MQYTTSNLLPDVIDQLQPHDYAFALAYAIALAGATIYLVKCRRTPTKAEGENVEVMKLHFRYIVGILIGLLILVATFRWSDLKDFTIYLSNIATFTSLALALVAIIISVVAGNAVSRDIGTVSQVTTEVRQSVIQVSGLLSSASQVSEDARRSNAELGTLINDLRREFAASSIQASNDARNSNAELGGLIGNLRDEFAVIRSTSETLAATTQSIGADVATIPGKIEKLEIKIAESTASMKATAGPTPTGATSEAGHLHNLLRRSSPGGELLMYPHQFGISSRLFDGDECC